MMMHVYLLEMMGFSRTARHSTLPHGSVSSVILWPQRWWMKSLREHMLSFCLVFSLL